MEKKNENLVTPQNNLLCQKIVYSFPQLVFVISFLFDCRCTLSEHNKFHLLFHFKTENTIPIFLLQLIKEMFANYFDTQKDGISNFQIMCCYMASASVTVFMDNPFSVYRQLTQQSILDPQMTKGEVKKTFSKSPLTVAFSGISPRLLGIFLKKVPVFGLLSGITYLRNEKESVSFVSVMYSSFLSAIIINPVRFIEKQQRSCLLKDGTKKSISSIFKDSSNQKFKPFYRGLLPHISHSMISGCLALSGQSKLQKIISRKIRTKSFLSEMTSNLLSSCLISPIYVILTNPITRIETIIQTAPIKKSAPSLKDCIVTIKQDYSKYGFHALFRGQGVGIIRAIVHLTIFHQARMVFIQKTKIWNQL